MTASTDLPQSATNATARFNAELFDRECGNRGATTNEEKAALVGVAWTTIHRFSKGEMRPRLDVARRIAGRLGVEVDDLWPVA